jgi:uncharacterized protein (DUF924 family)
LKRGAEDSTSAAEALLELWFGREPLVGAALSERMGVWFGTSPEFDALLRERFAALVDAAAAGRLDAWAASPRGRLALILLLDQLPRNLFRGEARAFATDSRALALALDGIEAGHDRALGWQERLFFYLPLEHAEDLAVQERSLALFGSLAAEAPPELREPFEGNLEWARSHHDLIARFGRFPHRNRALGRASSADEQRFLAQGGTRFGQ